MTHIERVYDDFVKYQHSSGAKTPRTIQPIPPKRLGITPISILKREEKLKAQEASGGDTFHPLSNVKGLYLYGGVGCGKTYMMDLLFKELPTQKKQRVHFHQFMMEVHRAMHEVRKLGRTADAQVDVVDEVAKRMITNVEVLCFDEVMVTDIADAMILRRLFNTFFRIGILVIFTSNRHPDDLYKGGLNRDSFVPFIRLIKERCRIHHIGSDTDYRLMGESAQTYFSPIDPANEQKFKQLFLDLTKGMPARPMALQVFGREVVVPKAVNNICWFTFAELCSGNTSPADFAVIAKRFDTIFLSHVPQFTVTSSDAKKRFIHLLDTLYQYNCKIIFLAQSPPKELELRVTDGTKEADKLAGNITEFGQIIGSEEDSFQFQRTISRLQEMHSVQYLQKKHKGEHVGLDTDKM